MLFLQLSGCLFLLPFAYFQAHSKKNAIECVLGYSLLVTVVLAQAFWRDPARGSRAHRVDAAFARISLAGFTLYTLAKGLPAAALASYLAVLLGAAISAACSHRSAAAEWCGKRHLRAHAALHAFCALGAAYAFL